MFTTKHSAPSGLQNLTNCGSYQQPRKREMTAEDIRNQLENRERELERAQGEYPALDKDIAKASKKVEDIHAEIIQLRKNKLEHKARTKETGQLFNWRQKERDVITAREEHPEKIQALKNGVRGLKQKLAATISSEKERKPGCEASKSAATASQPNITNTLPPSSTAKTATKRKATEEPQQQAKRQKPESSAPFQPASSQPARARKNNAGTNRRLAPSDQRRSTQTGSGALRPQKSRFTLSETAPRASRQANNRRVNTADTGLSTPNNAARSLGKKNTTASTLPSSSRTVDDNQAGSQNSKTKPTTNKQADDTPTPGTGSKCKISKTSRSANRTANGTTAAAGKKRKEMSKSTSGNVSAKDAPTSLSISTDESAAGSRRSTRSTASLEQSKEDMTPPESKKRRASDDENDGRGSKKQKTDDQSPKPTRLSNWKQACFSNVVVQMLDAGLGGQDMGAILGEVKGSEPFRSTTGRTLIESIKTAVVAGEAKRVSAAQHLRELLAKMHTEYNAQTDRAVDPKVFQLAVAYGVVEDANRNSMDGKDQQDAFEYYQLLLNILLEDPFVTNGAALNELFEIETSTHDRCASLACDYESTSRTAVNNYHNVDVPELHDDEEGAMISLDELLAKSKVSNKDDEDKCSKCNTAGLETRTEFTKLPETLVVKLNRTQFVHGKASKVLTPVIPDKVIHLGAKKNLVRYELSAVVMHEGDTIENGHYTIYRKQDGNWFWLDGARCEQLEWTQVKDLAKFAKFKGGKPTKETISVGHSAMMLYKKASMGN